MNGDRRTTREPRDDAASSSGAELLYRNVLDNVASGVMSLDSGGVVTSFNSAASRITGLTSEAVVGRTFAEVFSELDGADAFADVVLDAVYDSLVGHRSVVEATFAGRTRSVSMATSYLKEDRDGETRRVGVVAIFDDISEIEELRGKELRLVKEVQAKHAELRDAYLKLEERNRELSTTSKRTSALRLGAAVMVVALFLGMGLYLWDTSSRTEGVAAVTAPADGEGFTTLAVEPRRVTSTIIVAGELAPRREIEVTSPITGNVAAVHFRYGEPVTADQRLVDLDVTGLRIEHREAQVAHIKARDRVGALEDWSNHVEVSRARRVVSRDRIALQTRKNRLSQTAFLLREGVIPALEHEAADREYRDQLLELRSAEDDLRILLDKGAADLRVARLELDNARDRLRNLERTMRRATVHAPVAGVVMHPAPGARAAQTGDKGRHLARGVPVRTGERLLTIGDLDGVTVVGRVDEVDVVTIRPGHPATIVGDAFPGLELQGTIVRVSSQASRGEEKRGLPSFEVVAVVEGLTAEQRRLLRFGMSANLKVVVYDRPDALLVPIDAVELLDTGPRLRVKDEASGAIRHVEVVAGVTTADSVEIVSGIEAGDEIVIPGR